MSKIFKKIKDLLMKETYEDCKSILCSYLAFRYVAHYDEFNSFEDYMKDIIEEILEEYNSNGNIVTELGIKWVPLKLGHFDIKIEEEIRTENGISQ